MPSSDRPAFISEKISPVPGTSDLSAMSRGEPGVPKAFVWRHLRFDVARTLERRKKMGEDRGDVYVRRHYYDVETTDALRMTIYFDRNPADRHGRKQWWLYKFTYPKPVIETPRLALRRWTWADREAFHAMVSDPDVMRYIHDFQPLDDAQADQALRDTIEHYRIGYGDWAVLERPGGDIMGECGLTDPQVTDDPEITWLFHAKFWGKGYAHEAASAVLEYAYGPLALPRVIAHVQPGNARSTRLMEKLGMALRGPAVDRFGKAVMLYTIANPKPGHLNAEREPAAG